MFPKPQPFGVKNNMLVGSRGPIIADEVDIPSPHTREYHMLESDIHHMTPDQAEHFGRQFRTGIQHFDQHDTHDTARLEGRMAYRSWPADPMATNPVSGSAVPKDYTSGYSSLTTSRDPVALQAAHTAFQLGTQPDPFTSAPSTILGRDPMHHETLWSGSGPGMVTALLPERDYVALEALDRRTKHADVTPGLSAINAQLRSEVTRPHLFENKDLSSGVMQLGASTERRGKPSMRSGDPSSDFKLRENATRYQSYASFHGNGTPDLHNEMAVHYRQSGHSAPALEMTVQSHQPMKTEKYGPFNLFSRQVPDGPPVPVIRREDPSRNTGALQATLNTGHTGYPVLKK